MVQPGFRLDPDSRTTGTVAGEDQIGPAFRSSHPAYLLQMTILIAHALLKQEEPSPRVKRLGVAQIIGVLNRALNRNASRPTPSPSSRRR